MGIRLESAKFEVSYNPTGIVFDPLSIARHLTDFVHNKKYEPNDLEELNGVFHSWLHHSDFSNPRAADTLNKINSQVTFAHQKLASASYLFITLGTAFSYQLKANQIPVANCHKAPQEWFDKKLLTPLEMVESLQQSLQLVFVLNPKIQVVFTVSPVKHIRDGIVENNRSKARLLETVHNLAGWNSQCSYFPAYELVNDVLRDYRFYAADMAHPSEQAVDFVFDFLCKSFFTSKTQKLMEEVRQIVSAKNHKVLHPESHAQYEFMKVFKRKTEDIQGKLPMLNWNEELRYFEGNR
jgi:hypothetical protein